MVAWNLWTNVPTVKLWEAVALVLEIEPTSLRWPSPHYAYERLPFRARGFSSQAECDDFDKAMNFVERAPMATSNSSTRGRVKFPQVRTVGSVSQSAESLMARRWAASLSR